jgi:ABC-type multidrug transport system fused ATPase/permease subunit
MSMETASWILLIVVSSALTVFLIVLIVAITYFIGILKQVKRISAQAESAVESVQSAAETLQRSASPLAVLKLIGNIVNQASKFNKKRGK